MKMGHFYYLLFLALWIPVTVFACDCNPDASPWYKHLPNQSLGYIAQEFDKLAPAPGMNWNGDADDWFSNAAQFDWIEKTAPQDARVGAIILWENDNREISVGIVRQVTADHIVYELTNKDGVFIQSSIDFDTLANQFHLIGYIYPVKVDENKQARLILK
ncbi:hypothetical protein Ga0466249_001408 [Sporomusaceae bacterium BoRhaA]|uniref:CHAP domain-containing protein n=1 Tax=Pelorhabdus rhamnosifermentans TaxID=2772457 RepID=UPI001C0625FC|nr:CHAP domain-containing protein [Pelorhabdus rhamnosifermentans]MBU2700316.1 hypothetical protein [Pelorhabdus rhamnosifermentans]